MSLTLVVTVKGRKVNVKATSATVLAQVLQDACKQVSCDSAGYAITYLFFPPFSFYKILFEIERQNNKELDLSLPCRLLGLTNGAKLDVKARSSDGSRMFHTIRCFSFTILNSSNSTCCTTTSIN
jgi:TUG ubiquitin-like domain